MIKQCKASAIIIFQQQYHLLDIINIAITKHMTFQLTQHLRQYFQNQRGYRIHEKIGEGLECAVYRINLPGKINQQSYALKVAKPQSKQSKQSYNRNILKLQLESMILGSQFPYFSGLPRSFEGGFNQQIGYLVLQYLPNKNLMQFMNRFLNQNHPKFNKDLILPEKSVRQCIRQILAELILCLEHFRNNNLIHRDIKMQNIMLDEDYHIKVIDYSMSIFVRNQKAIPDHNQLNEPENDKIPKERKFDESGIFIGTAQELSQQIHRASNYISGSKIYLSPQTIAPKKARIPITNAVDIWAFGIVAYMLFYGRFPIQNASQITNFQLFQKIREEQPQFPQLDPQELDKDRIEEHKNRIQLLKGCLNKQYKNRYSIEDIMESEYFKGVHFKPSTSLNHIKQQFNPIVESLYPQRFIEQWKWLSQTMVRVKAASIKPQERGSLTFNKYKQYYIGIKQESDGHHWIQIVTKEGPKNKSKKQSQSYKRWLKIKSKRCYPHKDQGQKLAIRIQIDQIGKQETDYAIQELFFRFKQLEVLQEFISAISRFRK